MQKNRRYKKSRNRNKNRNQVNFESLEGESEFLNESADSMLTVSDSLGNMDPYDSDMTTEIDTTLLDEFAGDSELSAEHSYVEGNDSAPRRMAPPPRRAHARKKAHAPRELRDDRISSPRKTLTQGRIAAKAKSTAVMTGLSIKDKMEPMLTKMQEFVQPYREDLSIKLQDAYGLAKAQGKRLDKRIKTQPYVYALGAIVAGFALAQMFSSNGSQQHKR